MNALSQDSFQQMCDQVSAVVDAVQYERMRWARDVGPRLAEMVTMTLASIEGRIDLEFSEEQSTTEIKRFILKVHGVRVIGLTLWIEDGQAHMQPVEIDRSRYLLSAKGTLSVELDGLNAEWIAQALRTAFGLIEAREEPKAVAPPPTAAPAKQAAAVRTQTLRAG
ncbi:hypothetical protein [Novosphingobium sp.]|uniref:hypothetical protein n=1 Tax=Novosphingobium sp. TaxID=1874826 RepID=UPI0025ECD533|nr:hypothetical protein [Novosphingobium sp.]